MEENNKYFEYILLFNMLNLKYYKDYAKMINEMGMQSVFCESWDMYIATFAKAYDLDYTEFRKALTPSFDFHINWFVDHPNEEVLGVVDEEIKAKLDKAFSDLWNLYSDKTSNETDDNDDGTELQF